MLWDLFNSYREAFRMYIRSKTRPKTVIEAEEKRLFWAKIYALTAFTSLIYCTYLTYKKNINFGYRTDIPKERAVAESVLTGSKKFVVYEGFKKVREFEITEPEEKSKS